MAEKRWENFWYYYKWHVIAAVFLLVCLIIGVSQCESSKLPDFSICYVAADKINADKYEAYGNPFEDLIAQANNSAQTELDFHVIVISPLSSEREQLISKTNVITEVSAGYSRLYIGDLDLLNSIISLDMCENLAPLISKDALLNGYVYSATGEIVGASIDGNQLLESMGIPTKNKYIAIRKPSEKGKLSEETERIYKENAIRIAKYILEN